MKQRRKSGKSHGKRKTMEKILSEDNVKSAVEMWMKTMSLVPDNAEVTSLKEVGEIGPLEFKVTYTEGAN
jgi:hypothetical protein